MLVRLSGNQFVDMLFSLIVLVYAFAWIISVVSLLKCSETEYSVAKGQ